MATEYSSRTINIDGIEANTIFLKPVYTDPAIVDLFRVMPRINYRKKMAFLGEMPPPMRKYIGCDFNPTTGVVLSEREIDTELIQINLVLCDADFVQTDYDQLLNYDTDRSVFEGTIILELMQERLRLATQKHIETLAFFGDRTSADPVINITDGLFTKYFPEAVAQNLIPYTPVVQANALGSGDAVKLMNEVYYNRTKQLRGVEKNLQRFYVSSEVYDRLEQDAQDGVYGNQAYITSIREGIPIMEFQGIEVVQMNLWDTFYNEYVDPNVDNAKLVVLTTRDNMVLGTDIESNMNAVRLTFDPSKRNTQIHAAFKLGFNYIHESLFSIAY